MMQTKKHLYEGMYIINATLSEDARGKALDRIKAAIEERGGKILETFDQGRKKLAYEIEGKREGYYYLLFFEVSPTAIKELWEEYHLNEDLIRFITLRTEEVPESIEFKNTIES